MRFPYKARTIEHHVGVPWGAEVEEGSARKALDLALGELGPYSLAFTRSGRFAALAGRRGHLAVLDWHRLSTICELQVGKASL